MIGGTDTSLTHVNNRWVFRARPNDSYSSRVIAEFGVNTLKLQKWAIVHSTDAFGSGGKTALVGALKTLGVEPVLIQGYTNNYQGVEGNYQFDENGDGLHGYNVVKNDAGKIVFMKHVEFPPQ